MSDDWQMIYSAPFEYEVSILKGKLEHEGIPAFILNRKDSAYQTFGEVELYTKREFLLRALQIVKAHKEEE